MPNRLKLIETEDGSSSLVNLDMNEGYHSLKGALGESVHVFIENGLEYYTKTKPKESIRIFEVGFGTGLNAWLSYEFAKNNPGLKINFESVETVPVGEQFYQKLNYTEDTVFQQIHETSWNQQHLFGNFLLTKWHYSLEEISLAVRSFDLIYFDAFAPSKQPEMWDIELLRKCYDCLTEDGLLVTYSAQGQFKRNLESIGFHVETLQGAMGKKEMVRARRMQYVQPS